ncbi:MAG: hypothetical protein KKF46_05105 [Nanoarchaeota archaeon]|nr:hypothetical protein [Nanoarchaeota archaeon]MBU1321712.1 hypothetical protein [Nanoarchaeota archaeon]MBU1597678.1 hypothetical protein [Nanoarchaeota archaeon]MBU2441022.1 hypothetical protein [Nanoarchaeota archaeon]
MKDSLLLKIALITSIVGIGVLAVILLTSGLQEIDISEAKELDEDAAIMITGIVERITTKDDFSIINIKKQEEITVIVFDKVNLSKGQRVEITGKTAEYKGEKEIIAEKIIIR